MSLTWGLIGLVLAVGIQGQGPDSKAPSPFVPLLSQQDAWKTLPALQQGDPSALPVWALATAKALPRTTASMLELEWRHRAASPLDAVLRGQIRLVVAHANGCAYSQAQAEADLRRIGQRDAEIQALLDDADLAPVLHCARKLTLAAYTVTDAEIAELARTLGDKQLVAVVQLVAFANFQDRLILALGISREPHGPLPPRDWRFGPESKAMPRPAWPKEKPATAAVVDDAEWRRFSFTELKKQMEAQRVRSPRIRVPAPEEVEKHLAPGGNKARKLTIKWSLVCLGYQPELANAWSACTRAFREEAAMDRVFEESLFWIVTRTLQCFY